MAEVLGELSKSAGIKLMEIKLHGVEYRKELVAVDTVYFRFPLMRIWFKYKSGRQILTKALRVYPVDVYPYGRKTIGIVEEIAQKRYKENFSWKSMGDLFYHSYDFSLENIKATIGRVELVFNRLLTIGLIRGLNVRKWVRGEQRSFTALSVTYRQKMLSGILRGILKCPDLFRL